MSLYQFRLLPATYQLIWVLAEGTFLAQRWQEGVGVNLYYLPNKGRGFFAEVGIDEQQDCFVVLRSFDDLEPLAEYAEGVRLQEE